MLLILPYTFEKQKQVTPRLFRDLGGIERDDGSHRLALSRYAVGPDKFGRHSVEQGADAVDCSLVTG